MPGLSLAEIEELMTDENEMNDAMLRRIRRKEVKKREERQKQKTDDD